jgi:hypothetical protein
VPSAVEAVAYAERGEGRSARESARAAGVCTLGKTLLSCGVSGVMSCAGLLSIGQTRTTDAHTFTNNSSKCAAGMCWRTMSGCGAYQRGAVSALSQYRNSHASFPKICVIFLPRSRRPSWNAQEDMMVVTIVHGKFIAEYPSYSVIQMFKRCQVEIELFHTTR